MSGDLVVKDTRTFEQKLRDKLKNDIGDLMSDEDLQQIVDRGVNSLLFEPRYSKNGYTTDRLPPLIHELIMDSMERKIYDIIRQWVEDNPEKVAEAIKQVIEDGIMGAISGSFVRMFSSVFDKAMNEVRNKVGMPPQTTYY